MKVISLLCVFFLAGTATAQVPVPSWQHETEADKLHAIIIERFVLQGKYLSPPRVPEDKLYPSIVVTCSQRKVRQSYLVVGAVLSDRANEARLDGKKYRLFDIEGLGTDGSTAFFSRYDLGRILQGHVFIVGVDEYLGGQIVVQFDIPDSSDVFNGCGDDIFLKRIHH